MYLYYNNDLSIEHFTNINKYNTVNPKLLAQVF